MGAGDPTPRRLRSAHGLTAVVLLACAWFAAPADAAGPVTSGQGPAVDAAAVTGQLSAATTANVAAAGTAVETTATGASSSAQRVVSGAAHAVAGTGAQPAVDAAIRDVTVAAPPPAEPAFGAGPRRVSPTRAAGPRIGPPTGSAPRRTHARQRAAAPSAGAATAIAPHGAASVHAAPGRPPSLDPISGAVGDSSASGASASLFFGGLAVLLTALCVAGPALRRRLPGRRAMGWPAAFVPLLERPG
jgi:hypothetical protein